MDHEDDHDDLEFALDRRQKTIYECNFLCAVWLGICRVGTEFATSLQGLGQWHHRASPYNSCLSSKVMKCGYTLNEKVLLLWDALGICMRSKDRIFAIHLDLPEVTAMHTIQVTSG